MQVIQCWSFNTFDLVLNLDQGNSLKQNGVMRGRREVTTDQNYIGIAFSFLRVSCVVFTFCLIFTIKGRSIAFRGERGNDESPIEMIKVSHLK